MYVEENSLLFSLIAQHVGQVLDQCVKVISTCGSGIRSVCQGHFNMWVRY